MASNRNGRAASWSPALSLSGTPVLSGAIQGHRVISTQVLS